MADLADVENTLVALISQAVYPTGTANPSVAGAKCQVYRGWPIPANLDADLAARVINISVYPQDVESNATRYPRDWQPLSVPTPALTLAVSGNQVTVGGTPSSPLNAAVTVDGNAYVYAVQPGDTPTAIATGLAALISAGAPATSSGPVITMPGAAGLSAAVGGFGTILRETKRQRRGFQITFWCPTPALRDAVVPPVDRALADLDYIALPDGTGGRLIYAKSTVSDRVEKQGLYRRDLFYTVEYGTTDSQSAAQIVATQVNVTKTIQDLS